MSQSRTKLMFVWLLHEMLYTATSSQGSSCTRTLMGLPCVNALS